MSAGSRPLYPRGKGRQSLPLTATHLGLVVGPGILLASGPLLAVPGFMVAGLGALATTLARPGPASSPGPG